MSAVRFCPAPFNINILCGCSLVVKPQPSKLLSRVRFSLPAFIWAYSSAGLERTPDKRAHERAEVLYAEIDRNKLFKGTVEETSRSLMNICFVMNDEYKELEKPFLDFATERGMVGIKGHRSVGGFRASCYNAQTMEGVQALVKAMQDFEAQH